MFHISFLSRYIFVAPENYKKLCKTHNFTFIEICLLMSSFFSSSFLGQTLPLNALFRHNLSEIISVNCLFPNMVSHFKQTATI